MICKLKIVKLSIVGKQLAISKNGKKVMKMKHTAVTCYLQGFGLI